jgi:hypothetical protein
MVKNTRAIVRPFVSLMDFRKKIFLVDNPMNILPSMIKNGSVVSEIKI